MGEGDCSVIKKCYVLDGRVINIGEWDHQYTDVDGEQVALNPVPERAVIEERDFEYAPDRGWYEVGTEVYVEIESLKLQLQETDYKIIKCSEYQLAGQDLPYDIHTLHTERQALRDRINELEQALS
jgi:hypothetical protein